MILIFYEKIPQSNFKHALNLPMIHYVYKMDFLMPLVLFKDNLQKSCL